MTRPIVLLVIVCILSLAGSGIARAEGGCSTRDRVDLAKAGYSVMEITSLCEEPADQASPPPVMGVLFGEGQARWLQWCVTPQGRCPLFSEIVGYYPLGFPCNCYMPWGFYAGVAQ